MKIRILCALAACASSLLATTSYAADLAVFECKRGETCNKEFKVGASDTRRIKVTCEGDSYITQGPKFNRSNKGMTSTTWDVKKEYGHTLYKIFTVTNFDIHGHGAHYKWACSNSKN